MNKGELSHEYPFVPKCTPLTMGVESFNPHRIVIEKLSHIPPPHQQFLNTPLNHYFTIYITIRLY